VQGFAFSRWITQISFRVVGPSMGNACPGPLGSLTVNLPDFANRWILRKVSNSKFTCELHFTFDPSDSNDPVNSLGDWSKFVTNVSVPILRYASG
jgi:hypothetical protein